jgi:hypothetical protein
MAGLSQPTIEPLQRVQIAAAHLIFLTQSVKIRHASLIQLHWLLIKPVKSAVSTLHAYALHTDWQVSYLPG